MFSDAAGKDKKVYTAEQRGICPDYLAYGNGEDIQGQSRLQVVGLRTFFQRLYVTLAGRKSEEAALMVEQIFNLVGVQLLVAHEIEEDARIKITRARTHRDAARGSETHGGVDRYTVANSAEARSVTEVREDGSFWKPHADMMHERLIRETVETVAPNPRVE